MTTCLFTYFILCALLCHVYADLNFGVVDSGIDPGRISWWQGQWSPIAVELSKINEQASLVQVTVRWRAMTSVEDCLVEVELPSNFVVENYGTNLSKFVGTVSGGVEYLTTFSQTVTNPVSGVYGPVKIRTRHYISSYDSPWTGQIVDANENFAMLYVAPAEDTLSTELRVAILESYPKVGDKAKTLRVQFKLADDVWKHDLVKLTTDPYFTLASSVACTSYKEAGKISYFNGTSPATPLSIKCGSSVTEEYGDPDFLYIYGLGNDIDTSIENANSVEIRVSSVALPDRKYLTFNWKLEIIRYATRWVLQSGTYTEGPLVNPGAIITATWAPTWSQITKDKILPNMKIFLDMSITTVNTIPEGGSLLFEFSENIDKANYIGNEATGCYINNNIAGLACSVSDTDKRVTITGFKETPAIKLIVTIAAKFDADTRASITSITTKDSNNLIIDSASNAGLSMIGSTSSYTLLVNTGNTNGITFACEPSANCDKVLPTNTHLWLRLGLLGQAVYIKSGVKFTVYLPFVTQSDAAAQDKAFYINSDSNTKFRYVGHATTAPTSVTGSVNDNYEYKEVTPSITPSVGRDSGSFTWTFDNTYPTYTANSSAVSGGTAKVMQTIVHLAIVRTGGDSMTMPFVASNAETRYQIAIEIRDTNTVPAFNPYLATLQYSSAFMAWNTYTFKPFSSFNLAGTPAEVNIAPKSNNPFPPISASVEGRTYYIEVELNGYPGLMGSGLESGDTYPCVPLSGVTKISNISCEIIQDTNNFIRMKLLNQIVSTDTNIKWYFTLGSQTTLAAVTPKIRGIMIENDDLRQVKNIIYESSATSYTPVDPANSSYTAISATSTVTFGLIAGDELSSSNAFGAHSLQGATASQDYAVFIFPDGFTINSSTAALTLNNGSTNSSMLSIMAFSAEGMNWATLMGKEAAAGDLIDSGTTLTVIKVGGVKVAGYKKTNNIFRALCKTDFGDAQPIRYSSSNSAGTSNSAGAFADLVVSPTTVKGRGPGSTRTDVSVSFKTKNPIPAGGAIVLEMNQKWGYISDELNGRCVFSGLTDRDANSQVSCSYTDSKWSITNFSSVASGQKITVIFYNLLPPSYEGSSKLKFVTTLTSYRESSLTTEIDTLSSPISGNEISITANTATVGSSDIRAAQSIPMNAGLGRVVDLYMLFSFQYAIPKGGYFELRLTNLIWSYNDRDITKKCWLNGIRYASCEYQANSVKVTLGEDYEASTSLELYLDDAFVNPATTNTIKGAFMFNAYYGSLLIIEDYTGATFTPLDKLPGLAENSISVNGNIVGDYGDYTFSFESPSILLSTDQIWIVFPRDFDYFVGNAQALYSEEESTFYLECSSSQGDTLCTVDHNMVVITVTRDADAETPITITLYDVANPSIATGKTSERFQVFQYDTITKLVKAGSQDFGTISTSAELPTNLQLKSVTTDIHTLFEDANYEFTFYLSSTFELIEDHSIYIEFPIQYQLTMEGLSLVKCSGTIQEDGKDEVEWFKSGSCRIKSNYLVLKISSTNTREFLGTELIKIKVIDFPNPQWGYRRTSNTNTQDWEYDVKDNSSFGGYDYWTAKFFIYVYSEIAKDFIMKSYPESYAGYLGYDNLGKELFVNDFKPESWENRIVVYAGTQSEDIYITTESERLPCAAKSLVFSYSLYYYKTQGSSSTNVKLSSVLDKQTMFNGSSSIAIRVSAPIEAKKGFYYIKWVKSETMHSGVTQELYQPPVSTLVEVTHGNPYKFVIGEFPTIYRGEVSSPISISISNPPDASVSITITVKASTQSTKVKVTPSMITFYPDINVKYFTLEVDLDYALSISTTEVITFELSGYDAEAFTIDGQKTLTITNGSSSAGVISEWGISQITQTSAKFNPSCTKEGVIYVHLAVSGTKIPTADGLISKVGEVVGKGNEIDTLTDLELAKSNNQDINNTGINVGESWKNYRERIYKLHVAYVFVSAFVVNSGGEIDPFVVDWLWGDTEYQITGYHVVGSNQSKAKTELFTTSNTENSVSFKLKFTGNVPNDYSTTIREVLGKNLGISPSRLQYVKKENVPTTRQLQTASSTSTEMQFYILQERSQALPTPETLAESITTYKTSIQADLKAAGFRYTLTAITDSIDLVGEKPSWEVIPRQGAVTYNSITIEFLADIAGYVTCIADDIKDIKPTPDQVYLGLNAFNTEVLNLRVATDITTLGTVNSMTFTDLDEATTYYIWCVVSDSLPVWPTLQTESANTPAGLVITTEEYENPEEVGGSTGVYIKYLVSLLILAII
jgi:hypothetical protein